MTPHPPPDDPSNPDDLSIHDDLWGDERRSEAPAFSDDIEAELASYMHDLSAHGDSEELPDPLLPWAGELEAAGPVSEERQLEVEELLSDERSIAEALGGLTDERPAVPGAFAQEGADPLDDDHLDHVPYAVQNAQEFDTFVDMPALPSPAPEGFGGSRPTVERPSDSDLSAGWSRVAEAPRGASRLVTWGVLALTALLILGLVYWKLLRVAP